MGADEGAREWRDVDCIKLDIEMALKVSGSSSLKITVYKMQSIEVHILFSSARGRLAYRP